MSTQPAESPLPCGLPPSTILEPPAVPTSSLTLTLAAVPPASLTAGVPIHITRPVRYSLYRAPDRRWYLGRREWSSVLGRFETIQPVSGPYRPYAVGGATAPSGLELRYHAEDGTELPSGSGDTHRIRRVTLTLRAAPGAQRPLVERRDVASATVAFRNRR